MRTMANISKEAEACLWNERFFEDISRSQILCGKTLDVVERNGAIYGDIRKKLDELAGLDVFGAIAEYEKKVRGKPLNAQKWWA